jgi:hypothetical protein
MTRDQKIIRAKVGVAGARQNGGECELRDNHREAIGPNGVWSMDLLRPVGHREETERSDYRRHPLAIRADA